MFNSICEYVSYNNDDNNNIYNVFFFSFSSILQNNDISFERITKNSACDEQIFPSTKFPRQGDLVHLLLHLP